MNRTTLKRSRRLRECDSCYPYPRGSFGRIQPGDYYLEHVASPNQYGLEYQGWCRLVECRGCAEASGRGGLFPVLEGKP